MGRLQLLAALWLKGCQSLSVYHFGPGRDISLTYGLTQHFVQTSVHSGVSAHFSHPLTQLKVVATKCILSLL